MSNEKKKKCFLRYLTYSLRSNFLVNTFCWRNFEYRIKLFQFIYYETFESYYIKSNFKKEKNL